MTIIQAMAYASNFQKGVFLDIEHKKIAGKKGKQDTIF